MAAVAARYNADRHANVIMNSHPNTAVMLQLSVSWQLSAHEAHHVG